jgi:large subunit ribosomal protein L31
MKEGIHPEYKVSTVTCACGNTFKTRSTKPAIKLEICSACHPFFTGKQKLIDTAGRVERFKKRFSKTDGKTVVRKKEVSVAALARKSKGKILTTSPKRVKIKPETKKETKKEK